VPRLLGVAALAAPLLAWSWLRLDEGDGSWTAALVVALAVAPALVPAGKRRVAAVVVAALAAGALAFDVAPGFSLPWRILSRFGDGFLEFYDVQVPFAAETHPRMHGVLLIAVFAFTLAAALAAAACRPGLVGLALVVGVGWPGTLLPGHDLLRGALLLATVLAAASLVRRGPVRGVGPALAVGAVVVLGAVAASSSPAFAKRAFLDWQRWDLYTRPAAPVDVSYVWDSSYDGLTFRGKPTTVFRVKASSRPHYWRVSVLDTVNNGRWIEELSTQFDQPPVLGERGLVPRRALARNEWERQRVEIAALRDQRLPGGSVPMRFAPEHGIGEVTYDPAGVAYAAKPFSRGDSFDVSSYSPSPTPAELVRSRPVYPRLIVSGGRYREVQPHVYPRLFGTPGRAAYVRYLLTGFVRADELRPYARLAGLAEQVAGGARSPYAAAVALERWFRFGGGFVYDQHPPNPGAVPALAAFVAEGNRRGYCQHFAGAMALMLRFLGIPSRVAVGFTSGRYEHGEWVVSDRDAHMWVEAWFAGWGWLPFDPTPGRGGLAGAYSASSPDFDVAAAGAVLAGGLGISKFGPGLADRLGFGQPRVSPDLPQPGPPQLAEGKRNGRTWGLFRLLLVALAGAVLVLAAAKLAIRSSRFLTRDPRRLAAACRRDLRDFLLDQGLDVPRSATLRELAALIESEFGVRASAFGLHATAARFGPRSSAREAARAMRSDLRELRRSLRRELSRGERARGLLSLRSLGLA
jgi:transglutaminase-like putative cysteine protease